MSKGLLHSKWHDRLLSLITSLIASLKHLGKQRLSFNQCLWQNQKANRPQGLASSHSAHLFLATIGTNYKGVIICRSCASCSKISKIHRTTPILKKKLNTESQLTCPKSQGHEEEDLRPGFESNPRQSHLAAASGLGFLKGLVSQNALWPGSEVW